MKTNLLLLGWCAAAVMWMNLATVSFAQVPAPPIVPNLALPIESQTPTPTPSPD